MVVVITGNDMWSTTVTRYLRLCFGVGLVPLALKGRGGCKKLKSLCFEMTARLCHKHFFTDKSLAGSQNNISPLNVTYICLSSLDICFITQLSRPTYPMIHIHKHIIEFDLNWILVPVGEFFNIILE